LRAICFQSFSGEIDCVGTGLRGGNHLLQLTPVNSEGRESDHSETDLAPEGGVLKPMNVFVKLIGASLVLTGVTFAIISHGALLYRGWIGLGGLGN
jgi:hypothetical protein